MNANENTNSATCFLLGVMCGVAGALLFAPWSGEDTRRRISSGVSKGGRKLAENAQQLAENAQHVASDIKGRAEKVVETGKAALRGQKDRVNAAFDEGVRAYNEATAPSR